MRKKCVKCLKKYVWCIAQILCWMNVQRVVGYFLFLDDVYILVSISLCIFPALALWKDEKIKVLSSTFLKLLYVYVYIWSVIFNNKDIESKDESYARWNVLFCEGKLERNSCCDASCNENHFRCMTQMFYTKEIGTLGLQWKIIWIFKCNKAKLLLEWK